MEKYIITIQDDFDDDDLLSLLEIVNNLNQNISYKLYLTFENKNNDYFYNCKKSSIHNYIFDDGIKKYNNFFNSNYDIIKKIKKVSTLLKDNKFYYFCNKSLILNQETKLFIRQNNNFDKLIIVKHGVNYNHSNNSFIFNNKDNLDKNNDFFNEIINDFYYNCGKSIIINNINNEIVNKNYDFYCFLNKNIEQNILINSCNKDDFKRIANRLLENNQLLNINNINYYTINKYRLKFDDTNIIKTLVDEINKNKINCNYCENVDKIDLLFFLNFENKWEFYNLIKKNIYKNLKFIITYSYPFNLKGWGNELLINDKIDNRIKNKFKSFNLYYR